jgi:RyR domain
MNSTQIAHVCHEANRALQIEQADPTIPVSPMWEHLDEETKESAISGVQGIIDGNTPEQSHENWCRFKLDHGWKLGPKKSEINKEHPLLVPYDQLPAAQQLKDYLFFRVVEALADPD